MAAAWDSVGLDRGKVGVKWTADVALPRFPSCALFSTATRWRAVLSFDHEL